MNHPESKLSFWAKLARPNEPPGYHPLVAHSADVAAVLRRLLQPDSIIAKRLARARDSNCLSPELVARLVFVAAVHDLGKVNHSFQDQWHHPSKRSMGHVKVVLESLKAQRPALADEWKTLLQALGSWKAREAHALLCTAICHHGRPWNPPASAHYDIWLPRADRDPLAKLRELITLARRWTSIDGAAAASLPVLSPLFLHVFAGALTLADWIGSTRAAFPFEPWADDDPDRYWELAIERAERACTTIGLTPRTRIVSCGGVPLTGIPLLETIFPSIFADRSDGRIPPAPTPLQAYVASMELPPPGSRVLIESETGSGKTEAALALYARLRAAGHVGGLVFALPTRATATSMFKRVATAVGAMYEIGDRPTLALAMGGEQARVEVAEGASDGGKILEQEPVTYPDAGDRELVHWSSSSSKKFFAAEIVVGTIDQLLLGVLLTKHAHLRLAAFSRHLLVIDELHSYDRYVAQVLCGVLDVHSSTGSIALLMSATLSDRDRLLYGGSVQDDADDQSPFSEAVARSYPLVSVRARLGEDWVETNPGSSFDEWQMAHGGYLSGESAPSQPEPRGSIAISRKPPLRWRACDDDAGLLVAIDGARAGARVCILRNTVKGARETIGRLRESLGDAEADAFLWCPNGAGYTPAYHSRYILPDRKMMDESVTGAYGRNRTAGDGRILVATQVVEQSLDVDFDILVTDLCPVDVLLQRMGRVWRHRERDPSRPAACRELPVWVIEPSSGLEKFLGRRYGGENGWGSVYRHLGFLELTRKAIHGRAEVAVPGDNRVLIESVYHVDPLTELRGTSEAWEKHFEDQEGDTINREYTAKGSMVDFRESYIENATRFNRDLAGPVRTRIGDDRVRVLLPAPLRGIYDPTQSVNSVDLPWERLAKADVPKETLTEPHATFVDASDVSRGYELGSFRFWYGPQGWEWPSGDKDAPFDE